MLEAEATAGHHATGRSAALLTETYGSAPVLGAGAGVPTLHRVAARRVRRPPAHRAARRALDRPAGVAPIASAPTPPAGRRRTRSSTSPAPGPTCRSLRDEACAGAVHEPGAVDIDVDALHQGYLRSVRRAGGTVAPRHPGHRHRPPADAGLGRPHAGRRGRLRHRRATRPGAWGDVVAAMAGVEPLGLRPLRRTAFLFDLPDESATGLAARGRRRRPLLRQARRGEAARLPRRRDPERPVRRQARGARRGPRHRAHRGGPRPRGPGRRPARGPACAPSAPTGSPPSAPTPTTPASSGWSARAATASRPPPPWPGPPQPPPSTTPGPTPLTAAGIDAATLSPAGSADGRLRRWPRPHPLARRSSGGSSGSTG